MRFVWLLLVTIAAMPLFAQDAGLTSGEAPDYSREALRSILLEAAEEGERAQPGDPFRDGWPIYSFNLRGSKTTVRFNPFMVNWATAGSNVQINPIVDPFVMTGTAGSALSPRNRNRYMEWWVNRKLGFDIDPPD